MKKGEKIMKNNEKNIHIVIDEKQIAHINKELKNEKMRKGLWRDKYSAMNAKMRKRCEEENGNYVEGGWKNRKICSTKSQWAWKMENEMEKTGRNPLEKEEIEIKIKYPRKAVILYDKKCKIAQIYDAEMERFGEFYTVKIIVGKNKIIVHGKKEKIEEDLNEKIIMNNEEIKLGIVMMAALQTGTEIITITNVEGK